MYDTDDNNVCMRISRLSQKRQRATQSQCSDEDSQLHGRDTEDYMGLASIEQFGQRKRYYVPSSGEDNACSSSHLHVGKDGQKSRTIVSSNLSGIDSLFQSNEGIDSLPEVDWIAFLSEDTDFLPESNWEAEHLKYKAHVMVNVDYRGLLYNELDPGGEEDESPWHPYDPDNDQYRELPGVNEANEEGSFSEHLSESITVCYGMVGNSYL
jgi:hypothetical protein